MEGRRVSDIELLKEGCLVLYFYPKDETPGCTAQACAFRDDHEAFVAVGAAVVGVSPDSPESHLAFARNHKLPFRLLSDPQKELFKLFGVSDTLGILAGRETFVISADGVVRYRFRSQLFARKHVANALASLKKQNNAR
jgi:peroxiredoxin Q/BCP